MLSPSQARVLTRTLGPVTLPSFLIPAFQSPAQPQTRQFSATASSQSKLGRTPISIPPGVELTIGEPKVKKDTTTYLKIAKRTVSVAGPLGRFWARWGVKRWPGADEGICRET
jgi:large subunit ribosomal protein L6